MELKRKVTDSMIATDKNFNYGTVQKDVFCYDTNKNNTINYGTVKKSFVNEDVTRKNFFKDSTKRKDNNYGSKQKGVITNTNKVKLKREIGLLNAVTMTLNSIIGAGIFVTPKGVLQNADSVGFSLLVWLFVGMFCMIGAACYIELGTTFPKSGRDFTYIKECFGGLPAFLYLWVDMLCLAPASIAIYSLTFSNYVLELFFYECNAPPLLTRIVAALPICEYCLS